MILYAAFTTLKNLLLTFLCQGSCLTSFCTCTYLHACATLTATSERLTGGIIKVARNLHEKPRHTRNKAWKFETEIFT